MSIKNPTPTDLQPIWMVVGNILKTRPYGQEHETRNGTKLFRGGTKVYVVHAFGGMIEDIEVIGPARKSRRFISSVIRAKHVENLRVKLCYEPALLKKMHMVYGNPYPLFTEDEARKMCAWIELW